MSENLEDRSIVELRGLASAIGATFDMGDNRAKLISIIRATSAAKVPQQRPLDPLLPAKTNLSFRPARYTTSKDEVLSELRPFVQRGLVVSFPTEDTWHMQRGLREDSGTLRAPLVDVVRCAREIMR